MTKRIYITSGTAVFHCEGRHTTEDHGHHEITFVWVPGCVHIDDHDEKVLQGCDNGCDTYHFISGTDPRTADHIEG
jgi:hypothetical protein